MDQVLILVGHRALFLPSLELGRLLSRITFWYLHSREDLIRLRVTPVAP
jgi:hypothetical protein